jgi:hypothetical protein
MTEPEQPKTIIGLPYDFRRPTIARIKSRRWNAEDGRLFTPKAFGVGWTVNSYWIYHPLEYWRRLSR